MAFNELLINTTFDPPQFSSDYTFKLSFFTQLASTLLPLTRDVRTIFMKR